MTVRILYVENDQNFRETRTVFLRNEGWEVTGAGSYDEALALLRGQYFDVGIFDCRLENDDDEYDRTGLDLAVMEEFAPLPKIILTGFPSVDHVRGLLPLQFSSEALVDYLKKEDGTEEMINTIKKLLAARGLNARLAVEYGDLPLSGLAEMLSSGAPAFPPQWQVASAEALLRCLFKSADVLKIERKLWQRDGLTAVLASEDGDTRIIIGGPRPAVAHESKQYEAAAKSTSRCSTFKLAHQQTVHFSASAYSLFGAGTRRIFTLKEAYARHDAEAQFTPILQSLVTRTLSDWQGNRFRNDAERSLDQIYRELALPAADRDDPRSLMGRLRPRLFMIPAGKFAPIWEQGKYRFRLNSLPPSEPCVDPFELIYQPLPSGAPVQLIHSPRRLTGDNILTDGQQTWLTDFAAAEYVPVQWNFVELEAAIRFDWTETQELDKLYELERRLTDNDFTLPTARLDNPLRKPVKTIQAVRQLARPESDDWRLYHFGLLFQVIRRLAAPAAAQDPAAEGVRLAHLLMAAGLISHHLSTGDGQAKPRLVYDERKNVFLLDGHPLEDLKGQSLALLRHLYAHRGTLCTSDQIRKEALGQEYGANNTVAKAIERLREKLHDTDPAHPLVASGPNGYKLNA